MANITYGDKFTAAGREFTVTDTAPQIGNLGLAPGTAVEGAGASWVVRAPDQPTTTDGITISLVEVGAAADNHGQLVSLEPA